MASLHERRNLMGNGSCKAVHIFRMIETMRNIILALQGVTIAMLDFNHPAEDALVIC
jgi:hypothetical protein